MRRAIIVITLNNLFMVVGFNLWQAVFNNFAVEEIGVQADGIGLIQSIREVPGLLGVFMIGFLVLFLTEMRIAGLSVALMGVGVVLTAATHDLAGLIGATLLMSVGFHIFYPSNASALLLIVGPGEAPQVLGKLNSLGALASVVGTMFVFLALDAVGYRNMFVLAGLIVVVGSVALWPFGKQPVQSKRERRRPPVRRRYSLYYALEFLMGSRRHIFSTFAVFLLVRDYRVPAQVITLLFLVNSLIGMYMGQAIGKLVVRFGERRVLTANFVLLVFIFMSYAVIPAVGALHEQSFTAQLSLGDWVLFPAFTATPALLILLVLFIIDNVLFGFSLASQTYFQKIALGPDDITPNVSLGQTINHIAAVVIPVVGGVVWETIGGQYTFLTGVVIALISLALTQYLRVPGPAEPAPVEALAAGR
ncbi:MAG: MFS transporter [Anaerolineae bacterium]|nr:MFS transporter [Anaerolineae bacterium]